MPRLLGACLLVLGLPALVLADYKESYRKGIEAVDRKLWAEVAKRMREALEENPKEGEKVKLYGLRFEPYLPHFYLGLALANTGDCGGALKAFAVSEEQAAIDATPRHAELVEARKACDAKIARAATPAPPTPPATPHPTPTPEPTPAPHPSPTPKSPEPTPATTPAPAAPSPVVGKPSGPPADLLAAARAYFAGRYGESAAALAGLSALSGRAAAQSLLLRSASRYALYRIAGEQDAALRRQAAEDAAAARRADPSVSPDPEAFSPAFVEFFLRGR